MRRHFLALFGGIALLATLVPAGSAAWMFSLEEATDSANVLVQGDPIRDNHVLGDDNDPDYAGQTFYDVYFAAQVTPATDQISDSQILSHDQSSFSRDHPCYGGVDAASGERKLGRFENPSASAGEGTEYYRVFTGRTSITHNELEAVNQAFKAEVIDRTGSDTNSDTFPLSLIGWSPRLVCNFALGKMSGGSHLHWPSLDRLRKNEWTGTKNEGYIRVDGYYPNDPSLVLFSANNLLENYNNYIYPQDLDGNGRADIVLYPILSTGKNNHAYDQGNETITDAIGVDLFPGKDSSGNEVDMGGQGSNATYDPQLSQAVRSQVSGGTSIEVFRYDNVVFQEGSGSSLGFTLDPNRKQNHEQIVGSGGWPGVESKGRWDGDNMTQKSQPEEDIWGNKTKENIDHDPASRFYITNLSPTNNNLSSISINDVSAAPHSITAISGRYNIYFVDLINNDQELNEKTVGATEWPETYTAVNGLSSKQSDIIRAFKGYGITPYQIVVIAHTKLVSAASYTSEWSGGRRHYTYYAQTRALAIVLERVYEPRLVLGETGSASFSNGKAFTQVAGPTQHTYTLMNVNLDGNTEYSIVTERGNLRVTNDIFAIMLANQEDFRTYRMEVGGQAGPTGNGYDYSEFSGSGFFETTDEYGVGLVRPKDGFEGSYDLLVTVEMTESWNGTGTNAPQTVTIYGRRRAVYYVNVSTSIAIENAPTHASGSLKGFVDTSIYNYRFEAFRQSEALAPETSFVSKDGTSAKTFADILDEVYRSTGSYLQDITTGRIFTPMEFYEGSGATYEPQGSMALYLWKPGN